MNPKIIGISGKAGAGKDTTASLIMMQLENANSYISISRYSFADPLKRVCSELYGVPLEFFHNREKKEIKNPFWNLTPREMAQKVGTDIVRTHMDGDHWIKLAEKKFTGTSGIILISDVRFPNEAEWIRKQGGVLVNIYRDSIEEFDGQEHESENALKDYKFDFNIDNSYSLEILNHNIMPIVHWIKEIRR